MRLSPLLAPSRCPLHSLNLSRSIGTRLALSLLTHLALQSQHFVKVAYSSLHSDGMVIMPIQSNTSTPTLNKSNLLSVAGNTPESVFFIKVSGKDDAQKWTCLVVNHKVVNAYLPGRLPVFHTNTRCSCLETAKILQYTQSANLARLTHT